MKYFTIPELCYSVTANRHGINNSPDDAVKQNLQALIENVLDPIREKWGSPIIVSSGYRCQKLNEMVGGKKTSWHMRGLAADLQVKAVRGLNQRQLIGRLFAQIKNDKDLPFERVLFEHDSKGIYWVHIQFDPMTATAKRIIVDNYLSTR